MSLRSSWLRSLRRRLLASQARLIAPHDIYICGLVCAVVARNRDGLRGAFRHIGSCGRCDRRRKPMHRIPGNIIGVGGMDIAGCRWRWWRNIEVGFAIRRPVRRIPHARPESPAIISPVMMQRPGDRTESRMRRSKPCSRRSRWTAERLVRGKEQRCCAERRDQRLIHSVRHGTHPFAGYGAVFQATLGRALGARKYIINDWLTCKLNGDALQR
jgi:hypothetical protein